MLVIGGGIAGVAAALRLKDRGLRPLVLEREARVGGRMTTDRIEGFLIDRGVSLLGNRFVRMRALCQRLGLGPRMTPAPFSLGLRTAADATTHRLRAGRIDDILRSPLLSPAARIAFLRLSADLLTCGSRLAHGRSDRCCPVLDDLTAAEYFRHLGAGGVELFEQVIFPGLRGPVGGDPEGMSRAALFQVVWNILAIGTWNLSGGLDGVPEAIAAESPVCNGCRVRSVRRIGSGVQVDATDAGGAPLRFRARAALFAVPGHLVPPLCPDDLPSWLTDPLARTAYARMVSAHVALSRPPDAPYPGISFAKGVEDGVEIELEHRRAPDSCPAGRGLASLYFYPSRSGYQEMDDATLRRAAIRIVERTFPETAGASRFVHVIRWESGIARFAPGRMSEMVALRRRLVTWDAPFEFCGDYWDGIASESALRTGEQAADRLADRLCA